MADFRAIFRYSLDGDKSTYVGAAVDEALCAGGMHRIGTRCWEGTGNKKQLLSALGTALEKLEAGPAAIPGANPGAEVDHVWLYFDQQYDGTDAPSPDEKDDSSD